jgi:hypothetical protein
MKLTPWLTAFFLAAFISTPARATFIIPTIAGFSSQETGYGGRLAVDLVSGAGMSGESPAATHDSVSNDEWHTSTHDPNNAGLGDPGGVHAFVAFDLGAPTQLSLAYIWQYSEALAYPTYSGRGVKDFDILVAPPDGNYINLGTFELAIGGGNNLEPAQTIDLAALNGPATSNVEFVRFDIRTNFQTGVDDVVGLSAVRFDGVPANVPEPAAFALAVLGVLALIGRGNGRRNYLRIRDSSK